mmetsp:Transcript_17585/g.27192  ORF Transcript_17585/g.27192 Transcript_17585/m.27192 type:complete len:143 (-) Transcript_17585:104-532(-)|eukprot:CAMPEP_0170489046 /NCGR_PEP_ID=MMETSP0208-20121228/7454_1 /TAXON_ID=197538 /ORGANISM="Strombidium inclinatum, Strain S3" /LENGTH=142 /DNA_ID=CAMNT_0010763805 /DNA_START=630 /DNA_END=1058 /DNA_ORIENTATION=+
MNFMRFMLEAYTESIVIFNQDKSVFFKNPRFEKLMSLTGYASSSQPSKVDQSTKASTENQSLMLNILSKAKTFLENPPAASDEGTNSLEDFGEAGLAKVKLFREKDSLEKLSLEDLLDLPLIQSSTIYTLDSQLESDIYFRI